MRKLIRGIEPTNDKPSLILQCLRSIGDSQVVDPLLRTLFLEQLPEFVRDVLVINRELDLSELARHADQILVQYQGQVKDVAAVSRSDTALTDLITAVAALTRQIKSIKSDTQPRIRSPSQSRFLQIENNSNICYLHAKFRDGARRCRSPCEKARLLKEN